MFVVSYVLLFKKLGAKVIQILSGISIFCVSTIVGFGLCVQVLNF